MTFFLERPVTMATVIPNTKSIGLPRDAQPSMQQRAMAATERHFRRPMDDRELIGLAARLTGRIAITPPSEWAPAFRDEVKAKVDLALARERGRSKAGHCSYDFNRHIELCRARDRLSAKTALG